MRYVLLIYLDEAPFAAMAEAERRSYVGAMAEHDAELVRSGNFELGAALRLPSEAATVRVRQGRLSAIDGPFAETKEHLSGFIIIEARDLNDLPDRLETVLGTVYLVFNEGYSAHTGEQLMRLDLASEAIRLGRLIIDLLPDAEALGLLGLMLLQNSRRDARIGEDGGIILLEDQDRTLWDHDAIREGSALIDRAFATGEVGSYAIQGAIAAVHANARTPDATDWPAIVRLYDLLLRSTPSPVVRLNRAVAVGMSSGPQAAIELIDALMAEGALDTYHLAHAARADMHRRAGNTTLARAAYQRALELSNVDPERRFIRRRLNELGN